MGLDELKKTSMTGKVSFDDKSLKQLQETGEVPAGDIQGIPVVLMTVDARGWLHKVLYDDLAEGEMMALGSEQLDDPDGWGAPGMEVYGTMEGTDPGTNGGT